MGGFKMLTIKIYSGVLIFFVILYNELVITSIHCIKLYFLTPSLQLI